MRFSFVASTLRPARPIRTQLSGAGWGLEAVENLASPCSRYLATVAVLGFGEPDARDREARKGDRAESAEWPLVPRFASA